MRTLAILLLTALLTPSATFGADIVLSLPAPALAPLSFVLNDERPPKQRKSGPEAFSMGSCAYSSLRVGDDLFSPSRIALLGDHLQRDFPELLAGKSVTVKNFVIHRNFGKQTRKQVASDFGLAGSISINSPPSNCSADDLRGGYLPSEAPNDIAPIVTVLDLEIDGRLVHVRTVYEPPRDPDGRKPMELVAFMLSESMKLTLDRLSSSISANFPQDSSK